MGTPIPEPTPEEATLLADHIVMHGIPEPLMRMSAGYVHLMVRAMNSQCSCDTCAGLREMAETMDGILNAGS